MGAGSSVLLEEWKNLCTMISSWLHRQQNVREHRISLIHVTRLAVCEAVTLELVAIPPREASREGTRLAKGVDIDYIALPLLSRFLRPPPPCILLSALFIKNCLAAPVSPPNYLS